MKVWFENIDRSRKQAPRDSRTTQEQAFDSGVFAASEFVRRITRDDALSLMIHECCIWRQRELQAAAKLLDKHHGVG